MLNVFESDAFTDISLAGRLDLVEYVPQEVGTWLNFESNGLTSDVGYIDTRQGRIAIVPIKERGEAPTQLSAGNRSKRPVRLHYRPLELVVRASEVAGRLAFGSEIDLETVNGVIDERFAEAQRFFETGWELGRASAVTGKVRGHDGTVVLDLHDELGQEENVLEVDFADASTDINDVLVTAKEMSEDETVGIPVDGYELISGRTMHKRYVGHASTRDAFREFQQSSFLRADNRKGFTLADDVTVRSYGKGRIKQPDGGFLNFIEPDASYLCPKAPIYRTRFAPAETLDFVNTKGKPMYVLPERLPYNEGMKLKMESTYLSWTDIPRAIVKIVPKQG